jgi:peptide-methionine (S)-S-oxide reductase
MHTDKHEQNRLETIVFGGGCFWCTEAIFKQLRGVVSVMPGYSGGSVPNPTYEQVCGETTGHAEVIQVEFDPGAISLNDLLEVFFATHDPTTLNKQGHDTGEQYRSVIFYSNDRQKEQAESFIRKIEQDRIFENPVVTAVEPLQNFYEAETYHRDYFANNPGNPYCQVVINPKLQKFKEKFVQLIGR